MSSMSGPSNPQKVFDVLVAEADRWLCDDCVALLAKIPNRIAVNPITTTLGLTSDFEREREECSRCRTVKLVTRAV